MSFTLLDEFDTIPGSSYFVGTSVTANRNYLVRNLALADEDVRQWGSFFLRVFVPDGLDLQATCFSQNLYQRDVIIFDPTPALGALSLQVGLYAPVRSLAIPIQIWTE